MPNARMRLFQGFPAHFADELGVGDCPLKRAPTLEREDKRRGRVYSAALVADRLWLTNFACLTSSSSKTTTTSPSSSRTTWRRRDIASIASRQAPTCCRAADAAADLVILDLMLPGMDGLVVCQAMRADPATPAIPIIMLTARGEEADRVVGPRARRRRLRHQAVQSEGAERARRPRCCAGARRRTAPARRCTTAR